MEANRRNENKRTAAQEQLRADLRRLFGVDWSPEESEVHDIKFQVMSRTVAGPLSDEGTRAGGAGFGHGRTRTVLPPAKAKRFCLPATKPSGRPSQQVAKTNPKPFSPAAYEELQARTSFLEEMFAGRLLHLEDLELTPH